MWRPFFSSNYSPHTDTHSGYTHTVGSLSDSLGKRFALSVAGIILAAGSVAALTPSESNQLPRKEAQQSQPLLSEVNANNSSNNTLPASGQADNQHILDVTVKNSSTSNNSNSEVIINGQSVPVEPNSSRHEKIISNESTVDIKVNNSSYSSTSQSQQNSSSMFIELESYSSSSDDSEDSDRDINRRR
jgi:hypothetical protein